MPKTMKSARKGSRARKPARKRTIIEHSDASLIDRKGRPRRRFALNFAVVRSGHFSVSAGLPDTCARMDTWEPEQVAVAEAALSAGFQLAVPAPIEAVAYLAGVIARSLKHRLYMGFDTEASVLVVWIDEDEIEGEKDEDTA